MTAADWLLVLMWASLTCYVLLAGADFGGGLWDLFAGGGDRGGTRRDLIENSIGPVWEANHVWLIFVLVLCWTAFPTVFAAVASTAYIPLTLAALGIIARGAAFAFRKVSTEFGRRRLFGALFAASSVLTPFFLGTVAGAIASGRIPAGIAAGDPLTSWVNPTSLLAGTLAVGIGAYLAAVYLCADARRAGRTELGGYFRLRAAIAAVTVGVVAIAGIAILRADAPTLYNGLTGRALPAVAGSAVAGILSLVLVLRGRYLLARPMAAIAAGALLWGWALAQYPTILPPGTTVTDAAAHPAVLTATITVSVIGLILLIPALLWLYLLFQRAPGRPPRGRADHTGQESRRFPFRSPG
jgi:cytochrome d ubiquinol oxidase subunit II